MTDERHHGARSAVWRQLADVVDQQMADSGAAQLDVVDVGGGSGILAVPLAVQGHRVRVVDPSPNALATLRQRAREADVMDRIEAIQGEAAGLADLVQARSADVVLCHGVLEVLDDPQGALAGMARCVKPAGVMSIVAAQRSAAVIGKALAGHLDQAHRLLEDPDGRWGPADPLPRRFTESALRELLDGAGLEVRSVHGLRVFTDLVPGAHVDDPADMRALAQLEEYAATLPEMRPLAAALHLVVSAR